ncbi:Type I restriction enzyme S protein HsdS [Helicobacter sp. NHP21005]|nr:Type I restriction enzyme S protein HsdS [Helicobacter sp. NHP21005]
MRDLKIPLPPLEAQEQIVAVLSQIEQEIARLDQEIATMQGKEQEILQEFLGQERERERSQKLKTILNNLERAKALRESYLALFTLTLEKTGLKPTLATLLENLPTPPAQGWDFVKLEAHCALNQHSHNPSQESQAYHYIDIDCVENGTGNIRLNPPIAGKQLPTRARRLAPSDSVVISSVRPYLKGFAYIEASTPHTLFSTGFAILQGKESLNSKFLYLLFMFSADLMRQMQERMPKASYPSLNTEDFKALKIPLPPLQVQEKIVRVFSHIEQKITALHTQAQTLEGQESTILKRHLGT